MDELTAAAMTMTEEIASEEPVTVESLDLKIQELAEYKSQLDALELAEKKINEQMTRCKGELQKILDALGRTSYSLPGVGTATKIIDNSFKFPQDLADRTKVFEYIEQTYGRDALLGYQSINHQSFNTFIKTEREAGRYSVPGVGAPSTNEYVRFLPARKK